MAQLVDLLTKDVCPFTAYLFNWKHYINSIKPYKAVLLIQVLVRQQNFLNC